jgi:hypothetical protein
MPTLFVMMGGATQVHNHAISIAKSEIKRTNFRAVSIACFNGMNDDKLTNSGATGFFIPPHREKLNEVGDNGIQIIGMPRKETGDDDDSNKYKKIFSKFPTDYTVQYPYPNGFKAVYEGLGKDDQGIGDALVDIFMEVARPQQSHGPSASFCQGSNRRLPEF